MKRSKKKLAVKRREVQAEIEYPETPVEIAQVRETITRVVGNKALDMVRTTIADVGNGHYLAMKYLFEMVGLYPAAGSEERGLQDSMAKILLQNLGIPEDAGLREVSVQSKVTKDSSSPADEYRGHAVE